jgi:transposase
MRSLDDALISFLLALRRNQPKLSFHEIIEQAKQTGAAPDELRISSGTLHRLFKHHGLSRPAREATRETQTAACCPKHGQPNVPPPPTNRNELRKAVALFRFGVIADLVGRRLKRGEKERILRDKASSRWHISNSQKDSVSRSSIIAWLKAYENSGRQLESLCPRERCDKDKMRSADDTLISFLLALRKDQPELTVHEIIEQAKQTGAAPERLRISSATLHRLFKHHGLSRPSPKAAREARACEWCPKYGQPNAPPQPTDHNELGHEPHRAIYPADYGRRKHERKRHEDGLWMRKLLQGKVGFDELRDALQGRMPIDEIERLYQCVMTKPLRYRNRALAILSLFKGISPRAVSECLFIGRPSIYAQLKVYERRGVEALTSGKRKGQHKHENPGYVEKVFSILHSPPSSFGLNRTSWTLDHIWRTMKQNGMSLSKSGLRKIIDKSGFKYRKARTVLTSNDPHYREKVEEIKNVLANLGPKEKFFSIDEYGPFAVKLQGGKSLVPRGTTKIVPQWQKSKGSIIITAALELSTNQVTHFYSKNKNTAEMIKLLDILVAAYADEECIYFSWDAASWHASNELYQRVDVINSDEYRTNLKCPLVRLAPLPTCAQFLNVIESVFSGMAKAIIHNSDYQSVDECQVAIDRYFDERNDHFKKHPKKAGKKIWGKERVEATFKESNNCKDPKYR